MINHDFDHGTHQEFVDYYAHESLSDSGVQRLEGIFHCIQRKLENRSLQQLDVVDIGCGAGTLSMIWARNGHNVHGIDVNEALLAIAKQRAEKERLVIEFVLGSATNLPWQNESMDICIAPELLEHVPEWEKCLSEFIRILKPNGILFISTTNKLCPKQYEFNLPFYGWYPNKLKCYYENLARTTRPEIAGYAKYPAVNWFSFYQLKKEFSDMGLDAFDRFDIMDTANKSSLQKFLIKLINQSPVFRYLAHMASPGLTIIGVKNSTA